MSFNSFAAILCSIWSNQALQPIASRPFAFAFRHGSLLILRAAAELFLVRPLTMNKKDHPNYPMTVGKLKKMLSKIPDSTEIIFGSQEFIIARFKRRGENLLQIEFEPVSS